VHSSDFARGFGSPAKTEIYSSKPFVILEHRLEPRGGDGSPPIRVSALRSFSLL
jgi:hypothetical protein